MFPVFEQKDHMLWYPVQYEVKSVPRTSFIPVLFLISKLSHLLIGCKIREEFFLVGSDYVFLAPLIPSLRHNLQ